MKIETAMRKMPHRNWEGFVSEKKVRGYENLWVAILDNQGRFPSLDRWVLVLLDGSEIIGCLSYPRKDAAYNAMEYFKAGKNLNKFRKVSEKV